MARRVVTSLLLAAYLAGQVATALLCHAGETACREVQPHIHGDALLQFLGLAREQAGKTSCAHAREAPLSENPSWAAPLSNCPAGRSDCIYLPEAEKSVVQPRNSLTQALDVAPSLPDFTVTTPVAAHSCEVNDAPLDIACRGCALVVKLRQLRI